MTIPFNRLAPLLALPLLAPALGHAQDPAHATEFRLQHPGSGPGGEPRIAFLSHRLGNDHAEGISLLDMNGDGFPDLLSGAYWYENPGANGGEWKRHQFRTVGIHNEFVSDCGEWIVDVDHDGLSLRHPGVQLRWRALWRKQEQPPSRRMGVDSGQHTVERAHQ